MAKNKELILKVSEAKAKDVGRAIVRIDPADFQKNRYRSRGYSRNIW